MKRITLSMLLIIVSVNLFAQLKVTSDGKVGVQATPTSTTTTKLSVGGIQTYSLSAPYHLGIYSVPPLIAGKWVVGVKSDAYYSSVSNTGRSIGILGTGGNTSGKYNYGVAGNLYGTQGGAGVYGTIGGVFVNPASQYAGYFYGNTTIYGDLRVNEIITPSDIRLKENVEPLCEMGSALENVLRMNTISYNYKLRELSDEEREAGDAEITIHDKKMAAIRHYGLSAQELQEIYPDLVYEDEEGYLSVNYVELVPVLITAIQELKEEVDELKGTGNVRRSPNADNETSSVSSTAFSRGNILYQNMPNPFNGQTTIRFSLAESTQNASICIFDLQGKLLKELPVSSDMKQITVNSYELGKGMFLYSLLVNGQEIDTKKMIISK